MDATAPGSRVGTQFGRYQLRSLLGSGGMGEVYEAYDTSKDRVVALKLLYDHLAKDTTYQERFRRESHAAARLQEPHVIPIHDWGEIDGVLYIDMRLVVGHNLRSLLKSYGPMDPARAVAVISQVASALDAAHADTLIHRDVKPENVLVTRDDFAYLVDFGIVHSDADTRLTQLGSAIGSYSYMAPERFDDGPETNRVDVYALACVLHECLTGSAPFRASSVSGLIRAHVLTPPPQPSVLRPGVPSGFDAVIATGLAKDPAHRYPTAGDLARGAQNALTRPDRDAAAAIVDRAIGTTRVDNPEPVVTQLAPWQTGPPPNVPYSVVAPEPKRSTALPVLITLLVVGVLALAGVVGWLLLSSSKSDVTAAPVTVTVAPPTTAPTAVTTTIEATTEEPSSTTRSAPPATSVGVAGADSRGFTGIAAARCNAADPAVVVGRTTDSLVVICQTPAARYYYKGVRTSDGADIELDDPRPTPDGFAVTNSVDGTQYRVTSDALTILANGQVAAQESMVDYWSR
ncbi:serine/threonine-protein kinase [Antrihabitans cavernicola]|uniref:serine/threonine-protein kinase n=1 Tax=Antrihabitans cavernicola TaxID=2495913 RepID=UPI001F2ECEA7|nr:serine/threonine-protein kinase [Spelaeibacter cavernicola]